MRWSVSPLIRQTSEAATMVFVFLDRTGRSFVKCFLRQCFLDSFASFVVKKRDVIVVFCWWAGCHIRFVCNFEAAVSKG